MRIKIIFSYDGSNFCGYQKQPGLRSVQEELEKALSIIAKEEIHITSSGRTDAKVHALAQVAHFDCTIKVPNDGWKRGVNSLLPSDIHAISFEEVNDSFHARFSVKSKEYNYYINLNEYNPLYGKYMEFHYNLDVELMKEAINLFIGTHDFKGFSTECVQEDTVRTIYEARIEEEKGILKIIFIGSGFLKYMVRRLTGTLIEIGEHKMDMKNITNVLENNHQYKAGKTASPNGLYLVRVSY